MQRTASLTRNAVGWTLGNLVYFGTIFLITPLAIEHLGVDGWGVWQLVVATALYAQLLQLGLGNSLQHQVAVRSARGDWDGLATAFSNVRLHQLVAGVLLLALLAVAGRPLVASLEDADHRALAWRALAVTWLLTSVDFQVRFFGSALAGLQRMDLHGRFQIVGAASLGLAVWLGFRADMGLPGFAALMTLGPIVPAALASLAVRRMLPRRTLRLARPDARLFREMVTYSLSTLLYAAGGVVLYQTMKFVAAWRCGGAEAAGQLGLAISLAQVLAVVFTSGTGVLQSRVGQLHGQGRLAEVPALLEQALVALGLLLVPSTLFLVQDSRAIFVAWVGGTDAAGALDALVTTTRLLLLGHAASIAALPFYYVLLGVGRHRVVGVGMAAVAVANSVLGWFASGALPRIEVLGAVYGVLMLAFVLGVTAPAGLRRFPVPVGRVLARGLVAPLAASLPGALALAFRPRLGRPVLDLLCDALLFALLSVPGLELARRRFGLTLRLGLRG